jgi:hypothetical protein
MINVPYTDPRFHDLDFSGSDESTLDIVHDAAAFHPTWSGELRYRFRSVRAQEVVSRMLTLAEAARSNHPYG